MFSNTGSPRYRYFLSKVNIWNVNCARATAFIFRHTYGCSLWKCQSFWDRKCLNLRGTQTPNLRIHAECSNHLSYQGQTFAVPCFEYWLWRYRYFWSKVNIWNVNCAWATVFIFDTWTGALVKVSKFLRQKMSRPEWKRSYVKKVRAPLIWQIIGEKDSGSVCMWI